VRRSPDSYQLSAISYQQNGRIVGSISVARSGSDSRHAFSMTTNAADDAVEAGSGFALTLALATRRDFFG